MKKFCWLISKYLIQNIWPYFIFSWLLLSVILFAQQASRYADIFFSVRIPKQLVWELSLALIPNVVAFTSPMAILIGVIIGLSKMLGDSELVAIRAAGLGNFQIAMPIALLGVLLSIFAFLINLEGVPFSAALVRKVALQTALYKLESPVDPGSFNSEINGYTIYVKGGDIEKGIWKNIFIYNEDTANNQARLITSTDGRIDSLNESSELVLNKAVITTIPLKGQNKTNNKYISENVGDLRLAIRTRRVELIERLAKIEQSPEALGLKELAQYANSSEGKEKIEAQILWERRIILSITPLIFALLGTALVLRFNRGGSGFAIFLALISLIGYYLLSLLGEQIARTTNLSIYLTGLLPIFTSLVLISRFFFTNKLSKGRSRFKSLNFPRFGFPQNGRKLAGKNFLLDLTTGILDFDIIYNLVKYFLLAFAFLASIYLIFTAFELWKFVGNVNGGLFLLIKYLVFLIPFIYIQLAPTSLMIATLTTFVIKSRQNEIVTWAAAGRSIYRLLLPCFILMGMIGGFNWLLQEKIVPQSNQIQDELRTRIRNGNLEPDKKGKFWVANANRIFSFEVPDGSKNTSAKVKDLTVYEFPSEGSQLKYIYRAAESDWSENKLRFLSGGEKQILDNGQLETNELKPGFEIAETENPFKNLTPRTTHLNSGEIKEYLRETESEMERRNFAVALQKKYTTPILPVLIIIFTAPFALSLNRKGKALTVGYAVGFWLVYMGMTNFFEQMGLNGLLSAEIAVWTPLVLFSMFGIFLLTKVKT